MKLRAKLRLNHFYCENCEDTMRRMKDHTVSMVLTSPPYNNSKHTYTSTSLKKP